MSDPRKQVIALGGGGFSSDTDDSALDRYILEQATVSNPGVCFVPTASGDAEIYIQAFYAAYSQLNCRSSHWQLTTDYFFIHTSTRASDRGSRRAWPAGIPPAVPQSSIRRPLRQRSSRRPR